MNETQQIAREWIGHDVIDADGRKIGEIDEIYIDDASGRAEWLAIRTGWFGRKLSFAPVEGATASGEDMWLPFSKDKVKGAPKVDPDGHLDAAEENELYRYYGREHEHATEPRETTSRTGERTGEGVTLAEERLSVDKESHEIGRARLRKYVVTENVTMTVPVRHEEVRVVREPITGAEGEATIGAREGTEQEVVLHEEKVVATKEAVPTERVRLETETITEEEQVSEELRKEEVELEEDPERGTRRD